MGFYFGGDYNPEQWPEEVWAEDIALMREASVNLVSVGIFSWATLEPARGQYRFDWLDRVLDALHAGGIGVALATPTASPPPWFTFAHPDAMPVTAEGVRLRHGSRDTYCPSAPAYRAAALEIAGALAERYARHPALRLWHVHNEYSARCHCEHVAAAFRRWLEQRYGDLATLNAAWTTAFWSQTYADFAHILPPAATTYLQNPAHALDFRRFLSDELRNCFREQRALLRAANPALPVTTNFVFGGWVPVDHASWGDDVDAIAFDAYPDAAGLEGAAQAAFMADLARGWARGRPWLLMEQAPGSVSRARRKLPRPKGGMTRASLGYLARGSDSVLFFQWRASSGGSEFFHSALVPHAGPDSRVFREAVALGNLVARLGEIAGTPLSADVAILFDAGSWWATQTPSLPAPIDYLEAVRDVHRALWRLGITTDFTEPGRELSRFRLVLVPSLMLLSAHAAERLREYVARGGHLVVWYFSGVTDEQLRVARGGYLEGLREVLGVRIEEHYPLEEGVQATLSDGRAAESWSERIHATTAEIVATYVGGALDGCPAITRSERAWYVSARLLWPDLESFLRERCSEAGVAPTVPGLAAGVEVVRRGDYLFVLNHTDATATLKVSGLEMVTGATLSGELELGPGGYAVVREDRPSAR